MQNKESGNQIRVWEWKTKTEKYYLITSSCCDQYNYLYDTDCKRICAPSGGFDGLGSKDCPDFGEIDKRLIWQSPK